MVLLARLVVYGRNDASGALAELVLRSSINNTARIQLFDIERLRVRSARDLVHGTRERVQKRSNRAMSSDTRRVRCLVDIARPGIGGSKEDGEEERNAVKHRVGALETEQRVDAM